VKLASNENPLGPSPLALEAMRSVLAQLHLYPDGSAHRVKARLAENLGVEPGHIILGNGSNEILEFIGHALLGPGSEVVVSQYCFAVYPIVAALFGARLVSVPALDGFQADIPGMLRAITPATRAVFLANPNNPTGTFLAAARIEAFLEAVPQRVAVVLDEAYTEYLPPELRMDSAEWVRRYPNLIVSRTLSKAYGLAGLRVGYAIAHEGITDLLNRLRQPFNVNSLALAAAQAVLGDEAYLARSYALNRRGLEQLQSAFSAMQLRFVPSYANFVLVEVGDADAVYAALLRQGVIVRPVSNYGLPRWLRVSVGLPEENVRFIDALSQALRPASSGAPEPEHGAWRGQSTAAMEPERSRPQVRSAAGP